MLPAKVDLFLPAANVGHPLPFPQERSPADFICGQEDENDRAEVVLVCEPDLHNNLMGTPPVLPVFVPPRQRLIFTVAAARAAVPPEAARLA